MDDEKVNTDLSHVCFPEVRSFRTSREDLNRKLQEINDAFDEIERRRSAMPIREEEEAEEGD